MLYRGTQFRGSPFCCDFFRHPGLGDHDHINPILMELHWLHIRHRILFKILVLIYKGLHGHAPLYISALLVPHTPARNLTSSCKALLTIPKHKTATYRASAFSRFAPSQYNKLPCEITKSASLNIFKARIMTHLFKLVFNLQSTSLF